MPPKKNSRKPANNGQSTKTGKPQIETRKTSAKPSHETENNLTAEEIESLVRRLKKNPDGEFDEVIELLGKARAKINPYGMYSDASPDDTRCIAATITNVKQENCMALALVTATGFFSRMAREYKPIYPGKKSYILQRAELTSEYDKWTDFIATSAKTPEEMFTGHENKARVMKERQDLDAAYEQAVTDYEKHAQKIVSEFMASQTQYDPDRHVFKGVKGEKDYEDGVTFFNDESGNPLAKPATVSKEELMQTIRDRMTNGKKPRHYYHNRENGEKFCDYISKISSFVYNKAHIVVDSGTTIVEQLDLLADTAKKSKLTNFQLTGKIIDASTIIQRCLESISDGNSKLYKDVVDPFSAPDIYDILVANPPLELRHNLMRYFESHYVQLRNCARAIYDSNFIIDNIVQVHGTFPDPATAARYVNAHSSELRTAPDIIMVGQPTFLGQFKGNLDQVQFMEKNSNIVRGMLDRMKAAESLGTDIMRKVVKDHKRDNVELEGPDSVLVKELDNLHSRTNELAHPERILTDEERHEMNVKRNRIESINKIRDLNLKIEEMEKIPEEDLTFIQRKQLGNLRDDRKMIIDLESIPENAIGAYIFKADENGKIEQTLIHTQREDHKHMDPGSEFVDVYQPIEGEEKTTALDTSGL